MIDYSKLKKKEERKKERALAITINTLMRALVGNGSSSPKR